MVRSLSVFVVGGVFALAPVANAEVILGNYPPPNDNTSTAAVNDLRWKALSFSMPAATSADVGDLTVRLGNYDLVGETPTFEIRNHTGSTTAPGPTVLMSFVTPAPGGNAIQDYTFGPGAGFTLQGGTSYWLLMRGATGSNVDWRAAVPAVVPTGIATYGGQSLFTTNGGTSWSTSTIINSFQLVVIPEPSTLMLAGIGVLAGLRRRR